MKKKWIRFLCFNLPIGPLCFALNHRFVPVGGFVAVTKDSLSILFVLVIVNVLGYVEGRTFAPTT